MINDRLEYFFQTVICYSTPNTHPFISDSEKKFLNENVDSLIHTKKDKLEPTPWKALLRSVPLWALIFAGVSINCNERQSSMVLSAFLS